MGFGGNLNDYYDPENSYLSAVLRSRRGIPISLAILWMELALGLGLNASGVAFPGHFMLKVSLTKGQVVMDPLTGESLSREDLSERLEPFRRRGLQRDDFEAPIGLYLQPAPARDIIARMLRNLKEIHRTQEDWARLIPVLDRLITLLPQAWGEYRDRGLALAEQGQSALALADLEVYLSHAEDGLDIDAVAERALALRRDLN
jgi:regulator of sirC expression with transglutaminase-like and TPR domain